ncbi:hypothetical protein, partial [Oscillibacter sp.]|uniref:hypothetical protein n=1 Tax=Oscillibacter sp. TaxID=1945593 RepID=UPI002D7E57C3
MAAVKAMTAAMPRRASGMPGASVAPLYSCISKPASTSAAEKGYAEYRDHNVPQHQFSCFRVKIIFH